MKNQHFASVILLTWVVAALAATYAHAAPRSTSNAPQINAIIAAVLPPTMAQVLNNIR